MIYYFIPLFVCLIATVAYDIKGQKRGKGKFVWFFLFIYLTILIGVRFEVGGDTLNYMGYWSQQNNLSYWNLSIEEIFAPGYSLLCALSYTLSPEFYVFQLIHAFIFNTLLFLFLSRNTKYKFAALLTVFLLTYLYFATEILREVVAVLIFAFNYTNLKHHRWFRYYIGVLFSLMFHYSALILVILPFVVWVKFDKRYIWCCLLVGGSLLFLPQVVRLFEDMAVVATKLEEYSQDTTHGMLADFMLLLRNWFFPLFFVLFIKFGMRRSVRYENMLALMSLFGLAAYFSPIIFSRLANYMILFYAIAIGDVVIECLRSSSVARHNAMILIFSLTMLYGSNYIMYRRYMIWIPYYSIWNPYHADRDNYNKN